MGYSYYMYSKTTNGVTVTVTPYFLEDQSSPNESHYVWAYQVNIKNSSSNTMKLNHRNWLVIDANGKIMNISVIIPTYNRASTIKRAIDSVLSQTYKDFEVNSENISKIKSMLMKLFK